jgi:hypothetical protein
MKSILMGFEYQTCSGLIRCILNRTQILLSVLHEGMGKVDYNFHIWKMSVIMLI